MVNRAPIATARVARKNACPRPYPQQQREHSFNEPQLCFSTSVFKSAPLFFKRLILDSPSNSRIHRNSDLLPLATFSFVCCDAAEATIQCAFLAATSVSVFEKWCFFFFISFVVLIPTSHRIVDHHGSLGGVRALGYGSDPRMQFCQSTALDTPQVCVWTGLFWLHSCLLFTPRT